MNIQFYPLIYTATRGLDYSLWLSPPNVNNVAVDICRRCMADDLYGVSVYPKRLYVKTADFLLWGVSISNSMMIALDPYYYKDAADRPIRGFYGAYIPLDGGSVIPQSLPLDFDEGLPFTQNMLFEPFVEPYWMVHSRSELKPTAPIQDLTLDDDDCSQLGDSALDAFLNNPSFGCFYGLAHRNDENLNRIIQSFVRSQKNVGIVTGVESLTQARDLAKQFNIQFIELTDATEDSEIEIDPKPVRPPVVEPFASSYSIEDESEDEGWESDFTSSTSFDIPASDRKRNNTPIFKFPNKTAKIQFDPEPLNNCTKENNLADNFSSGDNDNIDNDTEDMFSSFIRYILNLWNSMWGTSPNESNDFQNVPPEKEEQPSVFQQELSKSEKKPFVPARRTISDLSHNPAFENRPGSRFSDDYDNNPKLLNNRFLSNFDNDANDPNDENDSF